MPVANEPGHTGGAQIPDRVQSTLLALILPVIVIVSTCVWVLTWRSELPDPVASHWGRSGVDRTTPLTTMVLIVAGIAVLSSIGGWVLAFHHGREAATRRAGVGFSLGLAFFLSSMLLTSLWIQRGLTNANAAPSPVWPVVLSLAAGAFAAAMGALAMPPDSPVPMAGVRSRGARSRPLDPRLPWVREIPSRETTVLSTISVLSFLAVGLLSGSLLILVPAAAVVGLIMFALARVTVTIDADGLRARGLMGWPHLSVPAEEILDVRAAWVSPMREFGGLGYRIGGGGDIGLVVRSGEGLRVTLVGLRNISVSVDDAPVAAELLLEVARAAAGEDWPRAPTD